MMKRLIEWIFRNSKPNGRIELWTDNWLVAHERRELAKWRRG
jgi:hypothetical protein